MNTKNLRTLLVQVRADEETRREEYEEFVRHSGLSHAQIDTLNVYTTPAFTAAILDGYDALWVGGSSDASVLKPEAYTANAEALLRHCVERNVPTFASCYGFEAVVSALGGEVIEDKENMEMGVYDMLLTAAGKEDPLLKDLPSPFKAISGHKERAVRLPEHCTTLAYTTHCPYHIFRVDGTPFYAFQFHPELDRTDFVARLTRYQERYLDTDGYLAEIVRTAEETPHANGLLRRFVEQIVCG